MMRFLAIAALVAVAAAGRFKQKSFTDHVNPYIEGQEVNPPTGVFEYVSTIPLKLINATDPLDPASLLENFVEGLGFYQFPNQCPEQMMFGAGRISVAASKGTCTLEAFFKDDSSPEGLKKETVEGTYSYFAQSCTWVLNEVTYLTGFDTFAGDLNVTQGVGTMTVQSGDFQNCYQQFIIATGEPNPLSIVVLFQPTNPVFGEIEVEQTSQGLYRLNGEMLVQTSDAFITGGALPPTYLNMSNNVPESTTVNLGKHTTVGALCDIGSTDGVFNKRSWDSKRYTKGYRGCGSAAAIMGAQFGSIFEMDLNIISLPNFLFFQGAAPFTDAQWLQGGKNSKSKVPFGVFMLQVDAESDKWATITFVNPQLEVNGTWISLLDDITDFSLDDVDALANATNVHLDYSINIFQRTSHPESDLEIQNLKHKETGLKYKKRNGKKVASSKISDPSNTEFYSGNKHQKNRYYGNGNKKDNRRKKRQQRKMKKMKKGQDSKGSGLPGGNINAFYPGAGYDSFNGRKLGKWDKSGN
jgi:hypothetical protein